MKQKRKHLTDAMLEPKTSEPLREFERRLKATCPQAVQLDLVAVQRLANDQSMDSAVELPTAQRSRGAWALAGSWVCGVAVGALVMFFLLGHATSTATVPDDVVHSDQETPDAIAQGTEDDSSSETEPVGAAELPMVADAVPRGRSEPVLTMAFDPLRSFDSTYSADGPTLQVGAHLRQVAAHSNWPFESAASNHRALVNEYELKSSATRPRSTLAPQPKSPVSRRELMHEFLKESTGAVL